MSDRNDNQRAAFDDDRLLDYALGIEDDPELAVALSSSARLRERLADLKSDLAAIETELHRTVPPIDESYADPGAAARWPRLQRSFGDGGTVRRRPRRGRRLTVALAAAALALAIVIGVVAVLPRGQSSSNTTSGAAGKSAAAAQVPGAAPGAQSGESATLPGATSASGAANSTNAASRGSLASGVVALEAGAYRDVAVVRAGPVTGAQQSFTVVRALKGDPPASFSLVLDAAGSAPLTGSLAIAYLRPLAATTVPSAAAQPSATAAPTGLPDFTYGQQPAFVAALPAGVAPAAVRLPK
jgi:hypothetical protein